MQQIKDEILEPVKAYQQISQVYSNNVDEYFQNLVDESKVDVATNKETCDVIYEKQAVCEKTKRQNKGHRVGKGFAIFFAIAGFITLLVGIILLVLELTKRKAGGVSLATEIMIPVGAVVGIVLTVLICIPINKAIKDTASKISVLEKEIKENTDKAWEQMSALNRLFVWNIPQSIINETVPLIKMDRVFEPKRFMQMINDYNYNPDNSADESVICVQSGAIEGNPFLFLKTYYTFMGSKVYTGTLVITWTVTVRDSNGTHTETRSQTLYASLTKPYPYYQYRTDLIYGNEAAPHLMFIRQNTKKDASQMNEKQLARYVKHQTRKFDKIANRAVKAGENFTRMGNNEFEALFNCTNRNNEVEYRLMFNPLGQKNMVELLKSKPYGDDFDFVKDGMINIIHSEHSQNFEYHASPSLFVNFDFEKIEAFFKGYCKEYLQSVYFDLAPLLSVPEYVLHKSRDFIYKNKNDYNLTYHEIESLCNYYGVQNFAHPKTASGVILKCQYAGKSGVVDNAVIHAYSYEAIRRVTYVPVHGGDGHTHNVPVVWYEYLPLEQATKVNAVDFQGYEMNSKKKNPNVKKDLGFDSVYGQKGLSISL